MDPKHYSLDFTKGVNGSTMILIFLFAFIFKQLIDTSNLRLIQFIFKLFNTNRKFKNNNIPKNFIDEDFKIKEKINERLENYWATLPGIEQKGLYAKELYLRTKNIKQVEDQ